MGFWGAICSIGSSITSGISSAVGSIGNALVSFASNVGPVIAKIVTELEPVAVALGKFAAAFLQGMGVLKPNEKPEDIGERALQAAEKGVTIEQFDNFDSYLAALRDFDLDAEKAAKRSTAEKLVAGIGVCTIAMERKYNAAPGSLDTLWLLPIANPSYFTPERMQSMRQHRAVHRRCLRLSGQAPFGGRQQPCRGRPDGGPRQQGEALRGPRSGARPLGTA